MRSRRSTTSRFRPTSSSITWPSGRRTWRRCVRPAECWTSDVARARWPGGWPTGGTTWSGLIHPRACSRSCGPGTPALEAVAASGTALPLGDDEFDLVLTVAALHHVAEPEAVRRTLGEMTRVSRPEGRILIWDHNPRNPYWSSLMRRVPQDIGEERLIGEREIVEGLKAAGARILSVQQLGLVPEFVPRWAPAGGGRCRTAGRAHAAAAEVRSPQRDRGHEGVRRGLPGVSMANCMRNTHAERQRARAQGAEPTSACVGERQRARAPGAEPAGPVRPSPSRGA